MSLLRRACRAFALLLLATATLACAPARAEPLAHDGQIDLKAWDFTRDGIVTLDGGWSFAWNRFDDPQQPAARDAVPIAVPGGWNGLATSNGPASAFGYGTYRLDVQCTSSDRLAMSLPVVHSAARWYVNGLPIAQQGEPGTTAREALGMQVLQIAKLPPTSCPLHIVAQVSNFDMRRGGLVRSVELGDAQQLADRRDLARMRDLLAMGGLVALGLLPLLFYIGRRKDTNPLWFGLFCLVFALGMGLTGTRVLQPVVAGLGWDLGLRIIFVCWYGSTVLYVLFVDAVYPNEIGRTALRAILLWAGVSLLAVLCMPQRVYMLLVPTLAAGSAAVGVYLGWRLLAAWRHGRRTALWMLLALATYAAAVAHDSWFFAHLSQRTLVPYGVIVFVSVPAYLIARRFARALLIEERIAIEQRERADLLLRSTKAGLLNWDAIANRNTYSDRYREMLGYPVGHDAPELPPFREQVHPDDAQRIHDSFVAQLRDRSVRNGVRPGEPADYRLRRADGSWVWVHAEAVAVCGSDGRTLRYICSFIDISQAKQHEIEITNRIKFVQDLFDSVPLGLALRDSEGRHLYVNRAWEKNMGLAREQVLGRALHDFAVPEAHAAAALDREAFDAPAGVALPARETDYRGHRFLQTRTAMVDAQGERIGVLVATLDITEKHATEQTLAMERERLRLLVRSTKAGFGDWDAIHDTVTYSERFKEMLGYPADVDTSGWPSIFELMHPQDRDAAREQFRQMIRRKPAAGDQEPGAPMSYRLQRRDGSYIWIHAEGIAQVDATGRTRRFITSYLDVTRFREQEDALRRQVELTRTEQRRLDLVVRGVRVGIVDWDGVTHETYYSPRFREIRGCAPDADTSGWPDYFKVMIHPDDRERITRRWVTFIKGKGPEGPLGSFYSPEEYRLLRGDGSYVWVQVSGMAVRDEHGFVVRWIAAILDITERRMQEEALRASRDQIAAQAQQLERQNEALQENVRLREEVERIGRHDIKTPLNSIVAVPRLLREERRLGPEADELLGIVERAGYRILSMVNLSLDLYKMEQGSYIFRPDAVDLQDLVDKVLADVRVHAASKGVHFQVLLAGVPYAWAEELLCYSLLANLIKNAVEASPEGQTVSIRGEAGDAGTVLLHIHNQGAVPAAIRSSFFQKYATLGKASGTGLGTYSARLMARVQDGDIAMHTADDEGTMISVTLRAAAAGLVPTRLRNADEGDRSAPLSLAALPATNVLLVDDDEYNLLIVRRFLPTPPFAVRTAINGRVAFAAAEREWPDLIFMDLDMPVMGGMETVRALRDLQRSQGRRPCSIIALSSHEDEATQQAAIAAGFDRYLTKPVTRSVVHDTVLQVSGHVRTDTGRIDVPAAIAAAGHADTVRVDADMQPMLAEYLASRSALIAQLAHTLAAGDREELRRIAHQLAGSFGLYGFRWASEQCRWIEGHASQVDAARIEELSAQLREHLGKADIQFVEMN